MDGKQTLIAAGGAGLILANFWTSDQRAAVTSGVFGAGSMQGAHRTLVQLGGEVIFVTAAVLAAGVNDSWANVIVLVILALWVLWVMHQSQGGASWTQRATGQAPATSSTTAGNLAGVSANGAH